MELRTRVAFYQYIFGSKAQDAKMLESNIVLVYVSDRNEETHPSNSLSTGVRTLYTDKKSS